MKESTFFTIGELARKMNITVRTLQYYDKEGLLTPSGRTEGGRRLYSQKDLVRLHQILSMKYLGFSLDTIREELLPLDTPEEVYKILEKQKKSIYEQIEKLQNAHQAVEVLQQEIKTMNEVSFEKYAQIISILQMNDYTFLWSHNMFNDNLQKNIIEKYGSQPETGLELFKRYESAAEKLFVYKMEKKAAGDPKVQKCIHDLWNMATEFTGGDPSLLSDLISFNDKKENWPAEMKKKQTEIDDYMAEAMGIYFQERKISIPEMENKNDRSD